MVETGARAVATARCEPDTVARGCALHQPTPAISRTATARPPQLNPLFRSVDAVGVVGVGTALRPADIDRVPWHTG